MLAPTRKVGGKNVQPETTPDNGTDAPGLGTTDNLTDAAPADAVRTGEPSPEPTAPTGEQGNGGTAPESFFPGDPNQLPQDVQPFYRGMQAAFTKGQQSIAAQRRELDNRQKQADDTLRELNLARAKYDAGNQGPERTDTARPGQPAKPAGPSDQELSERVAALVEAKRPFEALTLLADSVTERKVAAVGEVYEKRLTELQRRLDEVQGETRTIGVDRKIRAAWSAVSTEHPEFTTPKVSAEISAILQTPPPRLAALLDSGQHEAALELAGLYAQRNIEAGAAVGRAAGRLSAGRPGAPAPAAPGADADKIDWRASTRDIMRQVIAADPALKAAAGSWRDLN